jgi:hypothetical protein
MPFKSKFVMLLSYWDTRERNINILQRETNLTDFPDWTDTN